MAEQKGSELTPFQEDWLRYFKERRAAGEPYEKRAAEYHKAGMEFSKLLVTNLFVLNAGGLVSLPALSVFLGINALPSAERGYVLALAAAGFGGGLMFASLCALATYLNYHAFVRSAYAEQELAEFDLGRLLCKLGADEQKLTADRLALVHAVEQADAAVNARYNAGHITGWLALLSFAAGAVWLATQLR